MDVKREGGELGDGEVIPGGVWCIILLLTSYFVWGRLSLPSFVDRV